MLLIKNEPDYRDCKYINQNDFIHFCKENSVEIDAYKLENYEKEKLLFPIKRLIVPAEYAIFNEQRLEPLVQSDDREVYSKYSSLFKLNEELSKFFHLDFFEKIKHPFDENEAWQEYLVEPQKQEFNNWKDYDVDYIDKMGRHLRTTRFENYYSYWQMYQIDYINEFTNRFYQIRFDNKNNEYYLTFDKEIVEKFYRSTKNGVVRLLSFEKHYTCLCEFIQFFKRVQNIAFKEKKVGETLTTEEYNIFKKQIINLSNEIINKYSLQIEDLYKFLKELCLKYFDYEKKEKSKLQNLIKSDIRYCINLISYITGKTWKEVSSEIGESGLLGPVLKRYTKKHKNTLEIIFPDEEDEIKERAMLHIDFRLKKYNENVIEKYQLTKENIENFAEFIEKNGLSHFLMFMVDVNTDYFSTDYRSGIKIFLHLRNLSIFVDEIIKEIGKNAKSMEIRKIYSTDVSGFKEILHPICNKENWWNGYEFLYSNKKVSGIYRDNIDTKINEIPKNVESYSKVNLDEKEKFVLINISIATIIRNFYAHNSAQYNFFDKKYPLRLESLINSIFIIWAIGKNEL